MSVEPYVLGLDLGQKKDFTALALAELSRGADRSRHYAFRHLRRWPLGTAYTSIGEDVAELAERLGGRACLVVDGTGVGAGIVDLFRRARMQDALRVQQLLAVTITGGHKVKAVPGGFHVPKKDLVGAVDSALQTRRLTIARGMKEARALTRELQMFRAKVTIAGNETFEAWREREKDDLVLATALAVWFGEYCGRQLAVFA